MLLTTGEVYRVFVETTRYLGLRMNFALRNCGGRAFGRERRFFSPSRSGTSTGTELIDRERGMFATLTVTGQFQRPESQLATGSGDDGVHRLLAG